MSKKPKALLQSIAQEIVDKNPNWSNINLGKLIEIAKETCTDLTESEAYVVAEMIVSREYDNRPKPCRKCGTYCYGDCEA